MRTDVVLPVLNEAAALPWVLDRMPPGCHPIVVDNGSTDGSAAIAEAHGARIIHEPRRGYGAACHAGLVATKADVVCFMDCDGSLDPVDLLLVSRPVVNDEADLVVGARAAEPGSWPLHARVANRLLTMEIRRRTGVHLSDPGPMRAVRRAGLLALGIEDRRFGWPLEMILRAAAAGWHVGEVPVPYRARIGRSKVTGTVKGTARAVRDMARVLR